MANRNQSRPPRAARKRAAVRARSRRLGIAGGAVALAVLFAVAILAGRSGSPNNQPDVDTVGTTTGEVALAMLDGSTRTSTATARSSASTSRTGPRTDAGSCNRPA